MLFRGNSVPNNQLASRNRCNHKRQLKRSCSIKVNAKVKWIYIAPSRETSKALRHGSHSATCNYTDACLYLVSVHQMAPPQTEVANIILQPTPHLSTPKGWKAESAWFADIQRTVYPHEWSIVRCRSAGRAQNRESSPVKVQRSITAPRSLSNKSTTWVSK